MHRSGFHFSSLISQKNLRQCIFTREIHFDWFKNYEPQVIVSSMKATMYRTRKKCIIFSFKVKHRQQMKNTWMKPRMKRYCGFALAQRTHNHQHNDLMNQVHRKITSKTEIFQPHLVCLCVHSISKQTNERIALNFMDFRAVDHQPRRNGHFPT